ncbi:uncharacterized protein LOC143912049 [Arctopsyche grandis]|uniref:uncharacterized protein LOC143912049 n=1 Tax=Arctopsyche grandis TaxID=121162 RepID=UPI00406D9140
MGELCGGATEFDMNVDKFAQRIEKLSLEFTDLQDMLPKLDFKPVHVPKLIVPKFSEESSSHTLSSDNNFYESQSSNSSIDSTSSHDTNRVRKSSSDRRYAMDTTVLLKNNSFGSTSINDVAKPTQLTQSKLSLNHFHNGNTVNNSENAEFDSTLVQQVTLQYSGLDDIAGLADVKQSLREAVIYPTKYPQLFTNGRTIWSRALLYGAPGVGKTALVQAIAAEAKLPLYQVSSADLTSSWFGQSEKLVRRLFAVLGNRKCLLLMDEVDALCKKSQSSDPSHCRRLATELLMQIQTYEGSPMFLICTTNCPWEIDPAFMRRFQQRIYVPLPDSEAREKIILSSITNESDITADSSWSKFVNVTEGLTGSDLKNLTRSALMIPLREMQTASYWITIESGRMMPCDKSTRNAIRCNLQEIPEWKVWCRSLEMNDLWKALKKTDRSVTEENLIPYKEFMKKHATK